VDGLTQRVLDRLLEWGADLVGVAPVERFENAPEGHKPTDFMPECNSVISIALHIFQGMADVWGEHDVPEKTITPYLFYGYGLTNLESSRIVNRMAKSLEYSGYKTLAFMPTWISSMTIHQTETPRHNTAVCPAITNARRTSIRRAQAAWINQRRGPGTIIARAVAFTAPTVTTISAIPAGAPHPRRRVATIVRPTIHPSPANGSSITDVRDTYGRMYGDT